MLLAVVLTACNLSATEPNPDAIKVLYIGNSLTAANDLPLMVERLAALGASIEIYSEGVIIGGTSLEDHWNDGEALRRIERRRWDFVILQQGPSALSESRVLLVEYARRFGQAIRAQGGTPVLYMVWPSLARSFDFPEVSASYRAAATAAGGVVAAAGDAWQEAWRADPALPLYSGDNFHPSAMGTYLAALTIYQQITGKSPAGLPRALPGFSVSAEVASLLQNAAAASVRNDPGYSIPGVLAVPPFRIAASKASR